MKIKLNGREQDVEAGATLLQIIEQKELVLDRIVVEYNKEIIPKESLVNIEVSEKDSIEILSFVGGG